MRRWLIAVAVVFALLGGILAVAAANLGRFLDAQRERLVTAVRAEIGRAVEFGDVGISLRGGLGVRVADVRVPDDPAWSDGDVLRAAEVRVAIRVLPALLGRIEPGHITVGSPVLTVIRDQRGLNLDTMGPVARARRERSPEERTENRSRVPLVLALVEVRDGEIHYLDRRAPQPQELTVRQLDVSVSDASLTHPIAVRAAAALLDAEQRNLEVKGSIGPLGDPPDGDVVPLDLEVKADPVDLPVLRRVAGALDVALPSQLSTAGPLALRGRAQGTLDRLSIEAGLDGTNATVRWSTDFAKRGDLPLRADVSGVRESGAFMLRRATLQVGEGRLDVAGTVRPGPRPDVDVTLDSNRAPLGPLAACIPALAGGEVGGTAEAHLTVRGELAGKPLPVVGGTVALADVHGRRRPGEPEVANLTTMLAVGDGIVRMPASAFRIGDARVEAGGTFAMAERLLTVERASAQVFGGAVDGTGRVDLQDRHRPRFAIEGTAHDVALGALLAARRSELADHVDGRLDAAASLTAAGKGPVAVRRSLDGTIRLEVRDGVLRGVDLVDEILRGATGVERIANLVPPALRQKRPDLFGAAETRFEELRASARVADGRARTDDLVMRTSSYRVTGRGTVGLDGALDMTAILLAGPALTADVLATAKDARWVENDQGLLEVPIHLGGRLPRIRPQPDPDFVANLVARVLMGGGKRDRKNEKSGGSSVEDALRGLERLFHR
jgi:AsmA protein